MQTALVDPATNARSLADRARQAEDDGDTARARQLLEQARRADPDNAEINRQLAQVLLSEGKADAALAALGDSLTRDPGDHRGRFLLAGILVDRGELDRANAVLDEALSIDPQALDVLLLKGRIAEIEQQDGLALECYHRAVGVEPENIIARLRIAELQIKAERPDRAAPILRSICQSNQASCDQLASARWQLGIVYGRERRWEEAATELAAAIQTRPTTHADDWYRVAYAHRMAGNDGAASASLQRALELDPAHPAALALATALEPERNFVSHTDIQPARFVLAGAPPPAGW